MSLKRHLETVDSPLRQWFATRDIPVKEIRSELVAALRNAEPILPAIDNPPWSLLGNAIGLGVTWHLDQELPPAAIEGGRFRGAPVRDPATGSVNSSGDWSGDLQDRWRAGPSGVDVDDGAIAIVAGVLERFTRNQYRPGDDEIHDTVWHAITLAEATGALPSELCIDVAQAGRRGGTLLAGPGPFAIGPTFAGSSLVGGADADLVAGVTLWDVKANKDAALRLRDVHQLLGYALLDYDDAFALKRAGICCARFGVAHDWDLEYLLGGPLHEARAEVLEILGGAQE